MERGGRTLLILVAAASLGACSRSQAPASPAAQPAAQPAAVQPSPTPPPVTEAEAPPEPLSPDLAARLVRPHSPVLGPAKARVTVVEVLDPACEACRAFAP